MSSLPFHLLELNVVSAQDLSCVTRNMRTYAIAWINPDRKSRTKIDQGGNTNPTWNDKFVFRVDNDFLNSETASVIVQIYAVGWFRHVLIGSVRVLISNLLPPNIRYRKNSAQRFVALQVRRPSGRPQGILNLGVTLLDNTMKSMPLYSMLSGSDLGFRELMEAKELVQGMSNDKKNSSTKILRRSHSDCTEIKAKAEEFEKLNIGGSCVGYDAPIGNGSVVNGSSLVNGSEIGGGKNGSVCISDVGPSPSVVAAAVARGLYPTPLSKPHKPGSSILGDWTAGDAVEEGLESKIERWKMELPGNYDAHSTISYQRSTGKSKKSWSRDRKREKQSRRHSFDDGYNHDDNERSVIRCFGLGCEFTIVCGGSDSGSGGSKRGRSKSRSYSKYLTDSELS